MSKSSGKPKPPFSKVEQSLVIKANIFKFQFISFLPVYSQGHFKVVSVNSKIKFSYPDCYQTILLMQ